jgi:hypothetical protein
MSRFEDVEQRSSDSNKEEHKGTLLRLGGSVLAGLAHSLNTPDLDYSQGYPGSLLSKPNTIAPIVSGLRFSPAK